MSTPREVKCLLDDRNIVATIDPKNIKRNALTTVLFRNRQLVSNDNTFDVIKRDEQEKSAIGYNSPCATAYNTSTGDTVTLDTVKLPYIWYDRSLNACNIANYSPIVNNKVLTGDAQKWNYAKGEFISDASNLIADAKEVQSLEIIATGKLNFKGENIDDVVIDFGRSADNTIELLADQKWKTSTSSPFTTLQGMSEAVGGSTMILHGSIATWDALIKHNDVSDWIDTQAKCGKCKEFTSELQADVLGLQFLGRIKGKDHYIYENPLTHYGTAYDGILGDKNVYAINENKLKGFSVWGVHKLRGGKADKSKIRAVVTEVTEDSEVVEAKSYPMVAPYDINGVAVAEVLA